MKKSEVMNSNTVNPHSPWKKLWSDLCVRIFSMFLIVVH